MTPIKRGTDLTHLKHIWVAGNLNYGMSEICSIFHLYHNSNYLLLKYASNVASLCRAWESCYIIGHGWSDLQIFWKFSFHYSIRFLARTLQLDHFCSQSRESFSKTQWKFMKMTNICPKRIYYAKSSMVLKFFFACCGLYNFVNESSNTLFQQVLAYKSKIARDMPNVMVYFTWYSF